MIYQIDHHALSCLAAMTPPPPAIGGSSRGPSMLTNWSEVRVGREERLRRARRGLCNTFDLDKFGLIGFFPPGATVTIWWLTSTSDAAEPTLAAWSDSGAPVCRDKREASPYLGSNVDCCCALALFAAPWYCRFHFPRTVAEVSTRRLQKLSLIHI